MGTTGEGENRVIGERFDYIGDSRERVAEDDHSRAVVVVDKTPQVADGGLVDYASGGVGEQE